MPPEHVYKLKAAIQIYNLKGWKNTCSLRWVFVDLGKFMGQQPSISYRQSTGYHSYMYVP